MKKYIFLIVFIVFSLPLSVSLAKEHNKRVWESANFKIVEINSNVINVINGKNPIKYQFDLDIYEIYPNSSKPIILVVTFNRAEVEEMENELKAGMPTKFMACKTFIIDIQTGTKYTYEESCAAAITNIWSPDGNYALIGFGYYIVKTDNLIANLKGGDVPKIHISGTDHGCGAVVDADSWHWITNDVVAFGGVACGTFLDYLFYVETQKTEVYCSAYQKPRYGCPEHAFLSASEFIKRLMELSCNYDYSGIKSYVFTKQIDLKKSYLKTTSERDKKSIIKETQNFLFDILTEKILPPWLGTPWSFNGTTRTPGEGSIACGTFVVYILQDVGFKIPSKMARQPSENIIKNLIGTKDIKRFVNAASMEQVKNWIVESGEGLYIVGLDMHVGFMINKNNNITFFHSNYYNPPLRVVNQDLMETSPLTDSKYRVLGKILDEKMTEKWVIGDSFPLTYDYFNR